ncbi:chitin disaccharide deacetylase [Vibrio crassostreae]|uniref:Carbohydrate deacetylase n=3 Tax=Vibrio TaxID=662 RepID=A0A5M9P2W5_9VIBR|nr:MULTISPECIES: carbohydrate deacetylase [Vibrio]CAK1704030.1 chitin disaccharide deacetylase [Vibrio crassostreae]KAA8679473.1 carbohydrate deacetylase [Vibrio gigantis]MCC4890726.1 carbohydrate deacetylase [Vibrio sp. F13]PMK76954.1 PTS cellbiose transporter [Vibrio sp. 10N.261.52.E5]PMO06951.1 PTS cellbiose transporter [Vibrio cyclitrophicus]
MKLILNADDFGLTESVNLGIADCFRAGTVKSTTIMMNQPGVSHASQLYQRGLIHEVGLHFTVTSGKSISSPKLIPTLVDENGHFFDRKALFNKSDVSSDEVFRECMAQYQAALDAGFNINHIDSHHFAGAYRPLKIGFTQAANEIGLPVRRIDSFIQGQSLLSVPTPDAFDMGFHAEGVNIEYLKAVLLAYQDSMPNSTIELMCHPARTLTEELEEISSYAHARVEEWKILTSDEFSLWLRKNGIECVGFDALHA